MAAQLGVTRPTLREAIQRLSRDGWLTVAHGKPTVVNDYWIKGGLNVLGKLVDNQSHLPTDFIPQLLEVRLHLAPAYTRAAVARAPENIAAVLDSAATLEDSPQAYARFDWHLHQQLTIHSGNPIYTLFLIGFQGFYVDVGRRYFISSEARALSMDFYNMLYRTTIRPDPDTAETLCRRVMLAALDVWLHRGIDDSDNGG